MVSVFSFLIAGQLATGMPAPVEADIAWVAEGEFCEPGQFRGQFTFLLTTSDRRLLLQNK